MLERLSSMTVGADRATIDSDEGTSSQLLGKKNPNRDNSLSSFLRFFA